MEVFLKTGKQVQMHSQGGDTLPISFHGAVHAPPTSGKLPTASLSFPSPSQGSSWSTPRHPALGCQGTPPRKTRSRACPPAARESKAENLGGSWHAPGRVLAAWSRQNKAAIKTRQEVMTALKGSHTPCLRQEAKPSGYCSQLQTPGKQWPSPWGPRADKGRQLLSPKGVCQGRLTTSLSGGHGACQNSPSAMQKATGQ